MFNKNKKSLFKKELAEFIKFKNHKETFATFIINSLEILADYFIPHHKNDHKPKILHKKSLSIIVLLAIFFKMTLVVSLFVVNPYRGLMSPEITKQVLELINEDRTKQGLTKLALNTELTTSALSKANDMISKNYFDHYGPDGKKPWDWINRINYKYIFVGENLAMNFTTAQSVHTALMNSPTHKKNIMNPKYIEIGLGMTNGKINNKHTNVLVQLFASRNIPIQNTPSIAINTETKPNPQTIPQNTTPTPSQENIKVLSKHTKTNTTPAKPKPQTTTPQKTNTKTSKPNQTSNAEPPHKKELIKTQESKVLTTNPQTQTKPETENKIQPNIISNTEDKMLKDLAKEIKAIPNTADTRIVFSNKVINTVNNLLLALLSLITLSLIINIIVKIKIQHKPVILQTFLVILFIGSLYYFKFHFLEKGILNIFII